MKVPGQASATSERRRYYIVIAGGAAAVAAVVVAGMALTKTPRPTTSADIGSSSGLSSLSPSESADDSVACAPPEVEAGYLPWDTAEASAPPSHVERDGKVADVYWFPSETDEEFEGAYVHLRRYPYGGPRSGEERHVQGAPAALLRGPTEEAAIYWDSEGVCGHYSVVVDLDRSGGTRHEAADYAYRIAESLRFGN